MMADETKSVSSADALRAAIEVRSAGIEYLKKPLATNASDTYLSMLSVHANLMIVYAMLRGVECMEKMISLAESERGLRE